MVTWAARCASAGTMVTAVAPAADHDDAFVGIIEVVAPVLRMDDRPAEVLNAMPLRRITLIVAIISRTHEQKIAAQLNSLFTIKPFDIDCPDCVLRRPTDAAHSMAKADLFVDAEFARGIFDVLQYGRTIGNSVFARPWSEAISQGIHIGIAANTGKAEKVPGAADIVATLDDRPGLIRAALPQIIGSGNPGQACANNQHIDSFAGHRGPS